MEILLNYFYSIYTKKMLLMPALCSMLRLQYYAQNCFGIMNVTLAGTKPSTREKT